MKLELHFLIKPFGDWEESTEIAALRRKINVIPENQAFIIERLLQHVSCVPVPVSTHNTSVNQMVEIFKDSSKYNAYLFDSELSHLRITELAQILGFYVQQYKGKWILYLHQSSDIVLSLKMECQFELIIRSRFSILRIIPTKIPVVHTTPPYIIYIKCDKCGL